MKIEVLGAGCAKCKTLYENVKKAVEMSGKEAEVQGRGYPLHYEVRGDVDASAGD